MPDLTRSQFCSVTGLSADALASLSRRNQLPFSIDQKASGRGYTFFEAFLTIVSQELVNGHGVNVMRAADVAGDLPVALQAEWPRIVKTAWQLAEGTAEHIEEILCGRFQPAGIQRVKPVCGTILEIAQSLSQDGVPTVGLTLTNASRALTVLINRASRFNLEIQDEFWCGAFIYRQRPNGSDLAMKSMQRLIDSGEHLKVLNELTGRYDEQN
ncbi:hypothetical protein [Methylobacterium sp. SD21]|uniref:hypothetical protein n=1 Tax=Methylobacterium litchii TaxID=3138810 RepID=UPI00313D3467